MTDASLPFGAANGLSFARTADALAETVLVVDDSPIDLHFSSELIGKQLGWTTLGAATGSQALEVMRLCCPSLVLTDLVMPGMDGLALVQAVRAQFPGVPVVLMTAYGNEELAIKALRQGAASYVPKRILERHLIETLVKVVAAAKVERHQQRLLGSLVHVEKCFELANDPSLIPSLVTHLQQYFGPLRIGDENGRVRIGIALEEALLNGLYHGNLEVSSDLRQSSNREYYEMAEQRRLQPPYSNRRLYLEAQLSRTAARFVVRDEGPGFDTSSLPDPTDPANLDKLSGRGIFLIRTFMDEVTYNATGNQLVMVKRAGPQAA